MQQLSRRLVNVGVRPAVERTLSTIVLNTFGDAQSVLSVQPFAAVADPYGDQVKVKIQVSRISNEDIRTINGLSFSNKVRGIAGTAGVGSVVKVGSATSKKSLSSGDTVFISQQGVWSDEVNVPISKVHVVPNKNLKPEQLAHIDVVISAIAMVNDCGLSSGDTVLIDNSTDLINTAISAVAKSHNLKVVTDSSKADGKVKAAITSTSGTAFQQIAGAISAGGTVISYNSTTPRNAIDTAGISASVTSFIFNDIRIRGFDLTSWAEANGAACSRAVSDAASLLSGGQIAWPTSKSYASSEALTAISAQSDGKTSAILTFSK